MAGPSVSPAFELGDVFLLECTLCNPVKQKYFVAVCRDPCLMVLINSRINPFIHGRPTLLAAQVSVPLSEHPFMKHDSFVDCHRLSFEYPLDKIERRLMLEPSVKKGCLSPGARTAVVAALTAARTLKRAHRAAIAAAWS